MNAEVAARIQHCKEKQSTRLNLNNMGLLEIPSAVFDLTSLTRLFLANNQLSTLPEAITKLTRLREMSLANNQLSTLPEMITKLTSLQVLSLANNQLSTLPEAITKITRLQSLSLANNQLRTVPEAITKFTRLQSLWLDNNQLNMLSEAITKLTCLQSLWLDNNQLNTLPEAITQLTSLQSLSLANNQLRTLPKAITKLTCLQSLWLDNNQLSTLPEAITKLTSLTELRLSNNQLSTLPEAITKLTRLQSLWLANNQLSTLPEAITKLTRLRVLSLANNQLSTLPDTITKLTSLKELNLRNNQLSNLPQAITTLEKLRTLRVDGNLDLISPPAEIVAAGMDAVRNYFAAFGTPQRLHEAKLLLVGEPRAGKTSIRNKLTIPDFRLNKEEQSTEGIAITAWTIPATQSGLQDDFRLNVWDFGGQEIYKATHQFFLTRRSIYLFVTEARKHEDTSTDIFYYWFNVVRLLGGNSPLLVVHNKCDLPAVQLPMSDYYRDFPNILHGEMRVSCDDNHAETIDELKARIIKIVKQLYAKEQVGMELPATWVAVREAIAQLRQDHILVDSYYELCRKHGLDQTIANVISRVFHQLGVFLHFQDDIRLQDRIFLNHEWVTDAVYRVLDNREIIEQHGRFSPVALQGIWHEERHRTMRQKLIDLMCKFELCYPLANGDYLAPQLLPGDLSKLYEWRSEQNNLHFVYEYDFLPRGILSRVIVRLHHNIYQDTHWYSGVLLEWGGTRALVREERLQKRIIVRLEGGDRRGLLAIVRREIEQIHDSFGPELRVAEKIPCNCATCVMVAEPHFYSHEQLQSRLESGKYTTDCDKKPHHAVQIHDLLAAVSPPTQRERELDELQKQEMHLGDIRAGGNIYLTVVENSQNVAVGRGIEQSLTSSPDHE